MTLHESFENEIAKSFIGFISKVCVFINRWYFVQINIKVITGETQDTSLSSLIRAALKPWNTENFNIEDELMISVFQGLHRRTLKH